MAVSLVLLAGCAAPQYALRGSPVPEESLTALQIEQYLSAHQAEELDRDGARPIEDDEVLFGFAIQPMLERLARTTERPHLSYRAYLWSIADPNAAALADGRVYVSVGMLRYLADRGSRDDELAFILSHELAHTVAQHLVKRYRQLQQQSLLMTAVAAGTAIVSGRVGSGAAQAGRLITNAASILQDVVNSEYSQEDELEADQLGIRYLIRAGYDPLAALDLLSDFQRFDQPFAFLRTHPYTAVRQEHLMRYLADIGRLPGGSRHYPRPPTSGGYPGSVGRLPDAAPGTAGQPVTSTRPGRHEERDARIQRLRDIQRQYPRGSVSWQNLQRQIEQLERVPSE